MQEFKLTDEDKLELALSHRPILVEMHKRNTTGTCFFVCSYISPDPYWDKRDEDVVLYSHIKHLKTDSDWINTINMICNNNEEHRGEHRKPFMLTNVLNDSVTSFASWSKFFTYLEEVRGIYDMELEILKQRLEEQFGSDRI